MSELKSTDDEQLQEIGELPISDTSLQDQPVKEHTANPSPKLDQEPENGEVPKSPKPESQSEPNKSKYRYDWYQTASDVFLNIMIKRLKKDSVHVEFEEKRVSMFYRCSSVLGHHDPISLAF